MSKKTLITSNVQSPHWSRGMTLIEALVAMVVLSIGSGTLWQHFRSSARLNRLNMEHNLAIAAGQSEMEFIRILPKESVRDTAYAVSPLSGCHFLVTRTVFDSARIMEAFDEVDVDENLRPLYLRRPLEIRVDVRKTETPFDESSDSDKRPIATFSLLKPDYTWY